MNKAEKKVPILPESNEERFDAIIKATERSRAIVKAVEELQCVADLNEFRSTLEEVLIEWIRKTDSKKRKIDSVFCMFRELNYFFTDLEMIED